MPHQCTACGRTFEDGSKEMLSGCPDCGGNKFQFKPAGAADGTAGEVGGSVTPAATARKKTPENAEGGSPARDAPETEGHDRTSGDDRASAVNRAASTVRDWVSQRDGVGESGRGGPEAAAEDPMPSAEDPMPSAEGPTPSAEDSAQASARSDVVSESELPDDATRSDAPAESASETEPAGRSDGVNSGGSDGANRGESDGANPGLKELREELNSQFESIRIVEPGQYELNLMGLYEREEYIVSLQEDGKYVIEVPDAWDDVDR